MSSLLTLPPFDASAVLSGFSLVGVLTLLALLVGKDTLLMLLVNFPCDSVNSCI